jgi:hypothetical protein
MNPIMGVIMKKKFLYTILAVIVAILVLVVPAIHPVGRHARKPGVTNAALRAIREYAALNPAQVSAQELERKRQAAYNAAATMPNRLRVKHQAAIAQKEADYNGKKLAQPAIRTGNTMSQMRTPAKQNIVRPQTPTQSKNNRVVKPAQKSIIRPVPKADEDQEDDKEDTQPDKSTATRDLIGVAGALMLIGLYEFVLAPKMRTKKLGIAEFAQAVMNKQNPFTVKPEGQAVADNQEQQQAGPGFLKRFGFDIFLSFFGL